MAAKKKKKKAVKKPKPEESFPSVDDDASKAEADIPSGPKKWSVSIGNSRDTPDKVIVAENREEALEKYLASIGATATDNEVKIELMPLVIEAANSEEAFNEFREATTDSE